MELQSHHTVTGILKSHNTSYRRICSQQCFPIPSNSDSSKMQSLHCNIPSSHLLAFAMYDCRVSSNVLMRVPSYVQIGQLVQSLKWGGGRR